MKLKSLFFLIFIISCAADLSKLGDVRPYGTISQESGVFVFTVKEDFVRNNYGSPQDKTHPKMTRAEAKLLKKILSRQKMCKNGILGPKFKIISRQEQVFDVTFARLIEQNYNARPAVPKTYQGRCLEG